MDLTHITMTSERNNRLPLFADEPDYLEALHRLGRVCANRLALFGLIAEHLHLVALGDRAAAGRLAQAVQLALRPVVRTPIAPSHFQPVESRSHMRWLLQYSLEQPIKHHMPGHPALWVGSCFLELAGARLIDGLTLRISEALPDFRLETALRFVGLPGEAVLPAEATTLRDRGAHQLKSAVASALGVAPELKGQTPPENLARRAVAHLGKLAGIARSEVAAALSVTAKQAWRLERRPVAAEALTAIRRRITLEGLVQRSLVARLTLVGAQNGEVQGARERCR